MFISFFNLLKTFKLPRLCLPLCHGKDEGPFVGKEIPNGVFVWMVGCGSGRDVPATRNDLSTRRKHRSGLEGKEIIRIKQDGERRLQLLLASKSAQPEQQGAAHLLFYIHAALMVLFLSAP